MRLKNPDVVTSLNEYYSRALMYEFSLNNRDMNYINEVSKVLDCLLLTNLIFVF